RVAARKPMLPGRRAGTCARPPAAPRRAAVARRPRPCPRAGPDAAAAARTRDADGALPADRVRTRPPAVVRRRRAGPDVSRGLGGGAGRAAAAYLRAGLRGAGRGALERAAAQRTAAPAAAARAPKRRYAEHQPAAHRRAHLALADGAVRAGCAPAAAAR